MFPYQGLTSVPLFSNGIGSLTVLRKMKITRKSLFSLEIPPLLILERGSNINQLSKPNPPFSIKKTEVLLISLMIFLSLIFPSPKEINHKTMDLFHSNLRRTHKRKKVNRKRLEDMLNQYSPPTKRKQLSLPPSDFGKYLSL